MGNVAFITGATRGIGRQIAITLAKSGFDIALNYRTENDDLAQTKKEIENENVKCFAVQGDISSFESAEEYQHNAESIATLIPEFERDSVFSFMIDMQMFEATDMMPCCRYVVNLPFFIDLYPQALTDILEMLDNEPPKWLIIGDNFADNLPEIYESVMDKYDCIYENPAGDLYLLKGYN